MQSTQDKQVTDVLYAELKTPQRLTWEYQTAGSAAWTETDSSTLLFKLIPSGQVTSYRVKPEPRKRKACPYCGVSLSDAPEPSCSRSSAHDKD